MKAPTTSRLGAILRGLCPRCRSGRIFSGSFSMNKTCPVCHLNFAREHGYFTGAMYVNYVLAVPIMCVITGMVALLWYRFAPDWPAYWIFFISGELFLPFVPAVFRYSRIIWIHLDRYI